MSSYNKLFYHIDNPTTLQIILKAISKLAEGKKELPLRDFEYYKPNKFFKVVGTTNQLNEWSKALEEEQKNFFS